MNPWKVSTVVFAGLLAASLALSRTPTAEAEKQPHMKVALGHLKKAALQLDKASADKGGHRAKALALTREAIDQVTLGITFDNKR